MVMWKSFYRLVLNNKEKFCNQDSFSSISDNRNGRQRFSPKIDKPIYTDLSSFFGWYLIGIADCTTDVLLLLRKFMKKNLACIIYLNLGLAKG